MRRALITALLACSAAGANAQAIYRCGSTYSERPCSEQAVLQPLRAPDAADAAASRRETEREMKAADAMQKSRLAEESKPAAAYIPREKVEPVVSPSHAKPEVFTARAPGEKKKPAKKKKKKSEKTSA